MVNVFHYTDKVGWNAIRARQTWRFKASRPNDPERPFGVYFTDIGPSEANLRTLHKRLRVPRVKQEYVFWFTGIDGLIQLFGGRGRDRRIYFSPEDYEVAEPRQRHGDATHLLQEDFE